MVTITFNQEEYDRFVLENGVIGFLPTKLKSGRKTFWYANFRLPLQDMRKVGKLAEFIYSFCQEKNLKPTNFFAVPEGPREFSSSLNRTLQLNSGDVAIPAVSLRAGYKTYGSAQDRYTVGPVSPSMRPILVEDVGTTGSSATEYLMHIQELGISPIAVVSMLSRCERRDFPDGRTPEQVLRDDYNTLYLFMTDAVRILPEAVRMLKPDTYILNGLREELRDMERYAVDIKI